MRTSVDPGVAYYRFSSSLSYLGSPPHHDIVNGEGGVQNSDGSRYAYPNVKTVYLADSVDTCLAERLFYFQRQVAAEMDVASMLGKVRAKTEISIYLWRIEFKNKIPNLADFTGTNASSYGVVPALMHNPSQDYKHLQHCRAEVQRNKHDGLRAPSSRSRRGGEMYVLFSDQSSNVAKASYYEFRLRLIDGSGAPYQQFGNQVLDFNRAESKCTTRGKLPRELSSYKSWSIVEFNR